MKIEEFKSLTPKHNQICKEMIDQGGSCGIMDCSDCPFSVRNTINGCNCVHNGYSDPHKLGSEKDVLLVKSCIEFIRIAETNMSSDNLIKEERMKIEEFKTTTKVLFDKCQRIIQNSGYCNTVACHECPFDHNNMISGHSYCDNTGSMSKNCKEFMEMIDTHLKEDNEHGEIVDRNKMINWDFGKPIYVVKETSEGLGFELNKKFIDRIDITIDKIIFIHNTNQIFNSKGDKYHLFNSRQGALSYLSEHLK